MVRQSEELPLHRVLDLAILIAKSIEYFRKPTAMKIYDSKNTMIDRIGMQGDAMSVSV